MTSMNKTMILAFATLLTAGSMNDACAQKKKDKKAPADNKQEAKYVAVAGGTDYRLIEDKPGSVYPQNGDYLEVALNITINDSVFFDTYTAMEGQPAPLTVQDVPFKGDLMVVLKLLTEGDSAQVRQSVDSVLAAGGQAAPWMKTGVNQKMVYNVRVIKHQTKAQKEKEDKENAAKQKSVDDKIITDYLAANKIKATKTASGLYYKIDNPGTGDAPAVGQNVSVNYTGMLVNGEKFDSNLDPQFQHVEPFRFPLGQNRVIAGWDEGIALLKKGGKATLYIPSHLAYGMRSPSPKIPANSVLIFDVELVDISSAIGQ